MTDGRINRRRFQPRSVSNPDIYVPFSNWSRREAGLHRSVCLSVYLSVYLARISPTRAKRSSLFQVSRGPRALKYDDPVESPEFARGPTESPGKHYMKRIVCLALAIALLSPQILSSQQEERYDYWQFNR